MGTWQLLEIKKRSHFRWDRLCLIQIDIENKDSCQEPKRPILNSHIRRTHAQRRPKAFSQALASHESGGKIRLSDCMLCDVGVIMDRLGKGRVWVRRGQPGHAGLLGSWAGAPDGQKLGSWQNTAQPPQNVSEDYDLIFLLIKSCKCYFYEYFPIPPLAPQWELSKFPAFVKGNLFIWWGYHHSFPGFFYCFSFCCSFVF